MKKLFTILFSLFSIITLAQEESLLEQLNVNDLDTVVRPATLNINSASRSLKPISELPVNSFIITKETIERNNYRTLIDVLKDIPGYRVSSPGDAKIGESFSINGLLGNYYTKILINGIPISPNGAPGMPIGAQLPIRQAERIEIIKDPSSAIYGTDAMGGVINIITTESQKRASFGKAQISIAEYGRNEVNLLLGGQIGKRDNILKYSLFANHSESKDYNTKNNYTNLYNLNNYLHIDTTGLSQNPNFEGTAEKPYLGNMPSSNLMYGANIEYKDLKFSLYHFGRKDHSAIGKLPFYSSYQLPTTYWGEAITQATLTYDLKFSNLNYQSNLSYLRYRMDNGSSELIVNSPIHQETGLKFKYGASDEITIDQLLNFRASEKTNISLGANYTLSGNLPIYQSLDSPFEESAYRPFSKQISSNNSGYYVLEDDELSDLKLLYGDSYTDLRPFTFYQLGAFSQFDYSSDIFQLLIDLRIDYNSIYGFSVSPKLSGKVNITEELSAMAGISQSFKSPSSYYKYNSFARPEGESSYLIFPNSKLENEKLNAIELALKYNFSRLNYFEISSNYFVRSDEIIFSFSNPDLENISVQPRNYYGYVNNTGNGSTNLMIQGLLSMKNVIPSVKLDIDISVTYQDRQETTREGLLRYDTYRIQPNFLFQSLFSVNLFSDLYFITRVYGNSNYDNAYYEFYQDLFPGQDVNTALINQKNGGVWADFSFNYKSNDIISFFAKIRNAFNTPYSGIQTNDPLTGLYNNPQNGRIIEVGMIFKMY